MLGKLYEKWNIRDDTDFSKLTPEDYPILSDLYDLMEEEYRHYDAKKKELYTAELLQEICLGLHSMCKGAESKFFKRTYQHHGQQLPDIRCQRTADRQAEM